MCELEGGFRDVLDVFGFVKASWVGRLKREAFEVEYAEVVVGVQLAVYIFGSHADKASGCCDNVVVVKVNGWTIGDDCATDGFIVWTVLDC